MPKVTQLQSASVRTQTQVSGSKALYFSCFTVLLVMLSCALELNASTTENCRNDRVQLNLHLHRHPFSSVLD